MRSRGAAVVAVLLAAVPVLSAGCGRYQALEVGQCLPDDAGVEGTRVASPDVVPCSQPHRYEVFARDDLDPPDDGWPGAELVRLNAKRLCGLAVEPATGLGIEDLPDGVSVVHVEPTESSWNDGDREVECLFRWEEPTTATLVER